MNGMKHLVFKNFPSDLGSKFKALCALKQVTMRDEIARLITEELKRAGMLKSEATGESRNGPPGLRRLEQMREEQ